jgi:hypothetical protein
MNMHITRECSASQCLLFYVSFIAIPCISEEDRLIADKMGFTYTDVIDDDVIVHSGQVG